MSALHKPLSLPCSHPQPTEGLRNGNVRRLCCAAGRLAGGEEAASCQHMPQGFSIERRKLPSVFQCRGFSPGWPVLSAQTPKVSI